MRLSEKVAIITGGGLGIGRGIVKKFVEEGAKAAIADLNWTAAKKASEDIVSDGGEAIPVELDVRSPRQIEDMIQKTLDRYGKIDILVNNAGVSSIAPLVDKSEEDWDFNMDVNAKGTFLCTKNVVKQMIRQKTGGKIVCISSLAGKFGNKFYSHYSASKFAVIGFVKSVAMEIAQYKININAVCPGRVQTSMEEREIGWEARLYGLSEEEVKKDYLASIPLGRLETPEDVAKTVLFLASADADYITGVALEVTGGMFLGG